MTNTAATTNTPGFFLNAALDNLATGDDIAADAAAFANVTGEMVRVFFAKMGNGQEPGSAAVATVASAMESLGRTDDVARCTLQDMLLHGAKLARDLATAA